MNDELVQYFLVNKDIGMGKGKVAAQVAHAATIYTYRMMNATRYLQKTSDELWDNFDKWYNHIQKKIVLKAPQELLERLESGRRYISIRDKGYTQLPKDTLTVVTLGVVTRGSVKDIVEGLQLL